MPAPMYHLTEWCCPVFNRANARMTRATRSGIFHFWNHILKLPNHGGISVWIPSPSPTRKLEEHDLLLLSHDQSVATRSQAHKYKSRAARGRRRPRHHQPAVCILGSRMRRLRRRGQGLGRMQRDVIVRDLDEAGELSDMEIFGKHRLCFFQFGCVLVKRSMDFLIKLVDLLAKPCIISLEDLFLPTPEK